MHPFEPHFSPQGAFHGKLALSVCSNGACEATDEANFLIGGGGIGGTRFWVAGEDGHQSGSGAPAQGQPQQPVRKNFRGRVTNSTIGGKPLPNFDSPGRMDTDQGRTNMGRGGHRWR